jgi:hypothetical protein
VRWAEKAGRQPAARAEKHAWQLLRQNNGKNLRGERRKRDGRRQRRAAKPQLRKSETEFSSSNSIGPNRERDLFNILQQKSNAVFFRPTVRVRPLVRPIFQELLDQVAVCSLHFNFIPIYRLFRLRVIASVGDEEPSFGNAFRRAGGSHEI